MYNRGIIARAFAICLLPTVVFSAPILTQAVQWTPGTSPCNGACSLEWALERMVESNAIPQGVANRILSGQAKQVIGLVRPGDMFLGMSYAISGQAKWDTRHYQLADGDRHHVTDEYHVDYGGLRYRIANIRTCQNWAPRPPVVKQTPSISVPAMYNPRGEGGGMSFAALPPAGDSVIVRLPKPEPETPAPVPLPGALWALLSGLVGLFWAGRRRNV